MCSAEFVKDAVLRKEKAVKILEFLQRFVSKLSEEGVIVPSYRSSKLKNRLIKSFGNRLSYYQFDPNQK